MLTRDHYIAILEKRASVESEAPEDTLAVAEREYKSNLTDNRQYLSDIFDQAKSVEKGQSKQIGKLFPGGGKGANKQSGNPLLKVARAAFDAALAETDIIKTASPAYIEVAFNGFVRELEKVARAQATTVDQMASRNAVGQNFGRTWHLPDPDEAKPLAQVAKKVLPGTGTSLASGKGLLGRIGGLIRG